jgi:hypothetical protein
VVPRVARTYDDDGYEIPGRHYELHVWKEYQLYDCGTAELMQAIRNDFPDRPLIVFPDPTGDSRKISAPVGQTDFTIIRSFGANIFVPRFRTNSDKSKHVILALQDIREYLPALGWMCWLNLEWNLKQKSEPVYFTSTEP